VVKVIPLTDARGASAGRVPSAREAPQVSPTGLLADVRGRSLRDLRVSVTDRCNFRCVYCMPKDIFGQDYPFLPHDALLTFEEIARLRSRPVASGKTLMRSAMRKLKEIVQDGECWHHERSGRSLAGARSPY